MTKQSENNTLKSIEQKMIDLAKVAHSELDKPKSKWKVSSIYVSGKEWVVSIRVQYVSGVSAVTTEFVTMCFDRHTPLE